MTLKGFYWVLDKNHVPVEATDHDQWADFIENDKLRRVGMTRIRGKGMVSTIFTGLSTRPGGPMFETMWFPTGDSHRMAQWTYQTWDEAKAGHEAIVYKIKNDLEVPE